MTDLYKLFLDLKGKKLDDDLLIKLKNIREDSFEKISDNNFGIVENSIRELQKQVEEIRIKIPRRGSYNESEQKVRTEIKERFLY